MFKTRFLVTLLSIVPAFCTSESDLAKLALRTSDTGTVDMNIDYYNILLMFETSQWKQYTVASSDCVL